MTDLLALAAVFATATHKRSRISTPDASPKRLLCVEAAKRMRLEDGAKKKAQTKSAQCATPELVNQLAQSTDSQVGNGRALFDTNFVNRTLHNRRADLLECADRLIGLVKPDPSAKPCHLGEGTYAKVFSMQLAPGIGVACKNVVDTHGYAETARGLLELSMESRITTFFTSHLLMPALDSGGDSKDAPSSPHFVALMRGDMQNKSFQTKNDSLIEKKTPRCVSIMYLELCQKETFGEFYAESRSAQDTEKALNLALSVFGQMCMTILALGSVGVSHNDMRPSNWLLFSRKTPKDGLLYCIPSNIESGDDTYVRLPGGDGIPLLVLADFGVASVEKWRADPRFIGKFGTRAENLARVYYGRRRSADDSSDDDDDDTDEENVLPDNAQFGRLSLSSHGDTKGCYRPMLFTKIGEYERDFCSIFTFFEDSPKRSAWHECIGRVATEAIDCLSAVRPMTYTDQIAVVLRLLKQCKALSVCVTPKPADGEKVWQLPTLKCSKDLSAKLVREMSATVVKGNQFILAD